VSEIVTFSEAMSPKELRNVMGRKPMFGRAMTPAERKRRWREHHRKRLPWEEEHQSAEFMAAFPDKASMKQKETKADERKVIPLSAAG
jgi:hypothetical protein